MNSKELHTNVHFIGIGGISMSALAHILRSRGASVTGSDRTDSAILDRLRESGVKIFIGQRAENIQNPELVVYTAAIAPDDPELCEARNRGIPTVERADFLGRLLEEYEMPVAVSGTHGKTTTTAMLSCALLHAGYDPTVLVGGELSQIGGNFHIGSQKHIVFEACEYVDSFLKFKPFGAVVLNIEEDHLDYFAGIEQIRQSFSRFLRPIGRDGFAVLNREDENVVACAGALSCRVLWYGEGGDYRAEGIAYSSDGCPAFTVVYPGGAEHISLSVRGLHNVSNALAVFACAIQLGVAPGEAARGIESFRGTRRRFEYAGEFWGAAVYDDYAHHPTEIAATIAAARRMAHERLWIVFQPHTYTRTKALMEDFVRALSRADRVIVTDIYSAREKSDGVTHSSRLAEKIEGAVYISKFEDIKAYLKENARPGDLILTMGAGTITELSVLLVLNQ